MIGVDYSVARPAGAAIKAAGYSFVMRYLAPLPNPKVLTADEIRDLQTNGVAIGLVFEITATRPVLSGAAAGLADGALAMVMARNLGVPLTTVIYAAVDTDTSYNAVSGYLRAFRTANSYPTGVYGSITVVDGAMGDGFSFGWQACAWSDGQLSANAQLYQRLRPTVADPLGGCDEDVVLRGNPGLWYPTVAQPPFVQPAQPVPLPVSIPGKVEEMFLFQDSVGIYLLTGDGTVHVPSVADVTALQAAGVPFAKGISAALSASLQGQS